jgi:hypothetical protein
MAWRHQNTMDEPAKKSYERVKPSTGGYRNTLQDRSDQYKLGTGRIITEQHAHGMQGFTFSLVVSMVKAHISPVLETSVNLAVCILSFHSSLFTLHF